MKRFLNTIATLVAMICIAIASASAVMLATMPAAHAAPPPPPHCYPLKDSQIDHLNFGHVPDVGWRGGSQGNGLLGV